MNYQTNEKIIIFIPGLISAGVFTILFWLTASQKNYNVQEYFSFVYAQKCSFLEILILHDKGIGHPPLFHLLQKTIQIVFPVYHSLTPRIINYFVGIIFILIMINYLKRSKYHLLFIISLSVSASILDVFIFARMWGLVMLIGLALFIVGEEYLITPSLRNRIKVIGLFVFGLFADFNFILLLPYFLIVLFNDHPKKKTFFIFAVTILFIILPATHIYKYISSGWTRTLYSILSDSNELAFLFMQYLINFNYIEPIIVSILIILILSLFYYKKQKSQFHNLLIVLIAITILYILIITDVIRIRFIIFLLPFFIFYCYRSFRKFEIKQIWDNNNIRIVVSIALGAIILLAINPLYWAKLVAPRFIALFFPLIIILLYRNLSNRFLNVISVVFILSGINYMASAKVSDTFPAGMIGYDKPIIYEGPIAYSTQYLKNRNNNDSPLFLSKGLFELSCRVCDMGTTDIDFESNNEFRLIYLSDAIPDSLLNFGFTINKKIDFGLTKVDQWQFRHLTPIIDRHFYLYEMKNTGKTQVEKQ